MHNVGPEFWQIPVGARVPGQLMPSIDTSAEDKDTDTWHMTHDSTHPSQCAGLHRRCWCPGGVQLATVMHRTPETSWLTSAWPLPPLCLLPCTPDCVWPSWHCPSCCWMSNFRFWCGILRTREQFINFIHKRMVNVKCTTAWLDLLIS